MASFRGSLKENTPVPCLTLFSAQVLHLLGPKTETDLEKKPKVRLNMVLGPWGRGGVG